MGERRHTVRDRRQLQWGPQVSLQARHAALGELHVRQVRGKRVRPQGLHRLH